MIRQLAKEKLIVQQSDTLLHFKPLFKSKTLFVIYHSLLPAASQPGPDSASLHCKPAIGLEEMSRDQTDLWPTPINAHTNTLIRA